MKSLYLGLESLDNGVGGAVSRAFEWCSETRETAALAVEKTIGEHKFTELKIRGRWWYNLSSPLLLLYNGYGVALDFRALALVDYDTETDCNQSASISNPTSLNNGSSASCLKAFFADSMNSSSSHGFWTIRLVQVTTNNNNQLQGLSGARLR